MPLLFDGRSGGAADLFLDDFLQKSSIYNKRKRFLSKKWRDFCKIGVFAVVFTEKSYGILVTFQ